MQLFEIYVVLLVPSTLSWLVLAHAVQVKNNVGTGW